MKHSPCKRLTDLCFVFFNTTFFGLRPITHFGNPTARPFRLTITNLTKLANPNHFLFEKHGLRPHHSQFPIVGHANVQSARVDFHRVFHTCASIISLRPVPQWPVLLRPLSYRTFIVLRNGSVDAASLEGRGEIGHSYEYVIRSGCCIAWGFSWRIVGYLTIVRIVYDIVARMCTYSSNDNMTIS